MAYALSFLTCFLTPNFSDVVKSRKRKLSDLYYLTRYPTYPIDKSGVATDEDSLMAFLEKNDLESGHTFDEPTLPSRAIMLHKDLLPSKKVRTLYSPAVSATTAADPTKQLQSNIGPKAASQSAPSTTTTTPSPTVSKQQLPGTSSKPTPTSSPVINTKPSTASPAPISSFSAPGATTSTSSTPSKITPMGTPTTNNALEKPTTTTTTAPAPVPTQATTNNPTSANLVTAGTPVKSQPPQQIKPVTQSPSITPKTEPTSNKPVNPVSTQTQNSGKSVVSTVSAPTILPVQKTSSNTSIPTPLKNANTTSSALPATINQSQKLVSDTGAQASEPNAEPASSGQASKAHPVMSPQVAKPSQPAASSTAVTPQTAVIGSHINSTTPSTAASKPENSDSLASVGTKPVPVVSDKPEASKLQAAQPLDQNLSVTPVKTVTASSATAPHSALATSVNKSSELKPSSSQTQPQSPAQKPQVQEQPVIPSPPKATVPTNVSVPPKNTNSSQQQQTANSISIPPQPIVSGQEKPQGQSQSPAVHKQVQNAPTTDQTQSQSQPTHQTSQSSTTLDQKNKPVIAGTTQKPTPTPINASSSSSATTNNPVTVISSTPIQKTQSEPSLVSNSTTIQSSAAPKSAQNAQQQKPTQGVITSKSASPTVSSTTASIGTTLNANAAQKNTPATPAQVQTSTQQNDTVPATSGIQATASVSKSPAQISKPVVSLSTPTKITQSPVPNMAQTVAGSSVQISATTNSASHAENVIQPGGKKPQPTPSTIPSPQPTPSTTSTQPQASQVPTTKPAQVVQSIVPSTTQKSIQEIAPASKAVTTTADTTSPEVVKPTTSQASAPQATPQIKSEQIKSEAPSVATTSTSLPVIPSTSVSTSTSTPLPSTTTATPLDASTAATQSNSTQSVIAQAEAEAAAKTRAYLAAQAQRQAQIQSQIAAAQAAYAKLPAPTYLNREEFFARKASIYESRKASGPDRQVPWYTNEKTVNNDKDENFNIKLMVVPDRLPEPIQNRRQYTLAELYYTTQAFPLIKLLPAAHKTLTTETYQLSLLEGKLAVVHARIEELKRSEKWSLRQHTKFRGPLRLKLHWDQLIDEMKWLQQDFVEERRLKIAVCYELAQSVVEFHQLSKEERSLVCVRRKPITNMDDRPPVELVPSRNLIHLKLVKGDEDIEMTEDKDKEKEKEKNKPANTETEKSDKDGDVEMTDTEQGDNTEVKTEVLVKQEPVSDLPINLAASTEMVAETIDPKDIHNMSQTKYDTLVPRSIIRNEREVHAPLKMYANLSNMDAASQEIFKNLPLLKPIEKNNTPYMSEFETLSISSVTKFLAAPDLGPSWQKLLIEIDDERLSQANGTSSSPTDGNADSTKQGTLFNPENYRRPHSIRAPPPPNLKYLDGRPPTIWLPDEDQNLLRYAKDFQYNWNIVSAILAKYTTFGYKATIERRTPWQCFERWLQLNPTYSLSEIKGTYAPAALHWITECIKLQSVTKRRISPLGVGLESLQRGHSKLRWASMFEAMRKSMRNREAAVRPQSAVTRKPVPSPDDNKPPPTPEQLAELKYQNDKTLNLAGAARPEQLATAQRIPVVQTANGTTVVANAANQVQPSAAVAFNSNGQPISRQIINRTVPVTVQGNVITGSNGTTVTQAPNAAAAAAAANQPMRAVNGNPAVTLVPSATGARLPAQVATGRLTQEQQLFLQRKRMQQLQEQQAAQLQAQSQVKSQTQQTTHVARQVPQMSQLSQAQHLQQLQQVQHFQQPATQVSGQPHMSQVQTSPQLPHQSAQSQQQQRVQALTLQQQQMLLQAQQKLPQQQAVNMVLAQQQQAGSSQQQPLQLQAQQSVNKTDVQNANVSRAFTLNSQNPHIQSLMKQIATQNPSMTPDQVSKLAHQQIQQYLQNKRRIMVTQQQQQQAANQRAAAAAVAAGVGYGDGTSSPSIIANSVNTSPATANAVIISGSPGSSVGSASPHLVTSGSPQQRVVPSNAVSPVMGVRGVVMQGIPSSGINSPTINHAAAKPIAISASSSPAMANQPLVVSGAGPAANSRTATVSPAMGGVPNVVIGSSSPVSTPTLGSAPGLNVSSPAVKQKMLQQQQMRYGSGSPGVPNSRPGNPN